MHISNTLIIIAILYIVIRYFLIQNMRAELIKRKMYAEELSLPELEMLFSLKPLSHWRDRYF